jgi:3-hydroxybutyrate dehydrogenase
MFAGTKALAEDEVLARIPLKRLVNAEEVAALAVFLLSDAAGAITGAVHTVDGGFVAG